MMISENIPMRILIDGDNWNNPKRIFDTLDSIWPQQILSPGGGYGSADIHAINWAKKRSAEVVYYALEASIEEVIEQNKPTFILSFLNRSRPSYENWLKGFAELHDLRVLIVKENF